jgi:hypothetical protein
LFPTKMQGPVRHSVNRVRERKPASAAGTKIFCPSLLDTPRLNKKSITTSLLVLALLVLVLTVLALQPPSGYSIENALVYDTAVVYKTAFVNEGRFANESNSVNDNAFAVEEPCDTTPPPG